MKPPESAQYHGFYCLISETNFLAQESHFKFAHFCTKDKEYNKEFLTAIGKMMSDLADLYTALGGVTAANGLRKQKDFTKKVVVSLAIIS